MLLKLDKISKSYKTGKPSNKRVVLEGVDLVLEKGESIAILGPSGSGKSTLLNIIGALDRQDSGEVLFEGHSLSSMDDKQLTQFRNRQIGFIFQQHHLLPQCNVFENVMLPSIPIPDKAHRSACQDRAKNMIREIGLWEQWDQLPNVLSGGESQRVAVIRALINHPRLLLADEPTGSLDKENALSVINLLRKLNHEFHTALIVVTHSREIASGMNRIYELRDGKLLLTEKWQESPGSDSR